MYIKNIGTILRGFKKNKIYTSLNIVGLAVGFACVLCISLYIKYEISYDQNVSNYEKVFRLSNRSYALTSVAHLEYLAENFEELDDYTLLLNSGNFTIGQDNKRIIERKAFYATDNFFKIFPYKIKYGSYQDFNSLPNSVVITQQLANKVFGEEEVVGKEIIVYEGGEIRPYKVIAVLADMPTNSHMSFNMIAHMPRGIYEYERNNWQYTIYHGYFSLTNTIPAEIVQKKIDRVFGQRAIDNNWFKNITTLEELSTSKQFKSPLVLRADDIHLQSNLNFDLQAGGNISYLWVFAGTAFFVLLLAGINFINLATAQSLNRAKEVGIRKTLGASRSGLIIQFLSESLILCLIAAFLALGIVELTISLLRSYSSFDLSISLINNPVFLWLLFAVAIITAFLSGIYPAFYLTAFKPAKVLKGKLANQSGTPIFRNILVVFQFTISLCLGIFVYYIQDQLQFGLHKDPGFNKENLITIDNSIEQLGDNVGSFKNTLLNDSRFINAGYFNFELFGMSTTSVVPAENTASYEALRVYYQWVDADYLPTLGIELVAGQQFDGSKTGEQSLMIINETAANELPFDDPIGQYLNFGVSPGKFKIIGVAKDLHHQSFDKKVPPTLFMYSSGVENGMLIRLAKGDIPVSLNQLSSIWNTHSNQPLDYHFVDQQFENLFHKEQQLGFIINIFTALAFFVACLGLLGLAGYTAEQKTKEIGIRKALGASVAQIVSMFSSRFAKLVLLSMVFAAPLGYYITKLWLETFAYRIEMGIWPFLLIGSLGLIIVLLTVSYHMISAAIANPVNALKDE